MPAFSMDGFALRLHILGLLGYSSGSLKPVPAIFTLVQAAIVLIHSEASSSSPKVKNWYAPAAIALFVVAFALYADLSRINLDRHGDMVENYAWGMLWQWGNAKHPPFFGWVTAVWFSVFERGSGTYYLLSAVSSGLTLLAIWRIALRYGDQSLALLAVLVAMMLPPMTFLAIKYNASSAMTPIWAAAFLFYLRGLEKRKLYDAVILGALAGAAMLTKYHSAVLLGALFLHALFDKDARPVLFSAFGFVTAVTFFATVAGHVLWLIRNDFLPITYAAEQGGGGLADVAEYALSFLASIPLYILPGAALLLLINTRVTDARPILSRIKPEGLLRTVEGRALLSFAILPTILTLILGIGVQAEISSVWALPFYTPFAVLLALLVPEGLRRTQFRKPLFFVASFFALLLALTPFLRDYASRLDVSNAMAPLEELVAQVDEMWATHGGRTPAPALVGERVFVNAAAFYSRFDPYVIMENNLVHVKDYASLDTIRASGTIGICRNDGATWCAEQVQALLPTGTQPQSITIKGTDGASDWPFLIWIVPAQPAN